MQIFKTLFFASAKANHARRRLDPPRKAANHVIVRSHNQLGVEIVWIQFKHLLVIVPRTYCIPQSREPRMLDQCGVSGKLCARYSPRVNGSNVFGICG